MHDIADLLNVMAKLRDPVEGCPWDREQQFETIVPHTLEEAYEVADVIEREAYSELRGELGDLLFQVVFYSQLAREQGRFEFRDVVHDITSKMIRRHPHVFGDDQFANSAEQSEAWERIKADEKGAPDGEATSALDGVGLNFPALTRALKLQRKASRVGFDWPTPEPVFDKITEETGELLEELAAGADPSRLESELGDLLFACVNAARHLNVDPEQALRRANRKFERRFRRIETILHSEGREPRGAHLDELDALWERAKDEEGGP